MVGVVDLTRLEMVRSDWGWPVGVTRRMSHEAAVGVRKRPRGIKMKHVILKLNANG